MSSELTFDIDFVGAVFSSFSTYVARFKSIFELVTNANIRYLPIWNIKVKKKDGSLQQHV